jgi:putative hydrolase of the HAD superfamily
MEWIVFDYGGVISHAPPEDAGAQLSQTVGVEPERFWPVYWAHRALYDLGAVTAADYWRTVCADLDTPADTGLVKALAALDARAWGHINDETVGLLKELSDGGTPLALLSNAPLELARMVDQRPWAALFRHRLYSADLRLAKPVPEIFRRLTDRLGASPDDVLFVDDRAENVRAAEEMGIRSMLFTDVAGLRDDLARLRQDGRSARYASP